VNGKSVPIIMEATVADNTPNITISKQRNFRLYSSNVEQ